MRIANAFLAAALFGVTGVPHETYGPEETPVPKHSASPTPSVDAGADRRKAAELLGAIAKRFGVEITWEEALDTESLAIGRASPQQIVAFAPVLEANLALYPKETWSSGRVQYLALGSPLRAGKQHVAGCAVPGMQALFVDVSDFGTMEELRFTFHHEMFHLLDRWDDARWSALNEERFAYGPVPAMLMGDATRGIVSAYARTSAREDRAELFATMVTRPAAIVRLSASDEVLRRKSAALKDSLSDLGMDASFWSARR